MGLKHFDSSTHYPGNKTTYNNQKQVLHFRHLSLGGHHTLSVWGCFLGWGSMAFCWKIENLPCHPYQKSLRSPPIKARTTPGSKPSISAVRRSACVGRPPVEAHGVPRRPAQFVRHGGIRRSGETAVSVQPRSQAAWDWHICH